MINVNLDLLAKYSAIAISLLALAQSRKARKLQLSQHRRENIANVNVHVSRYSDEVTVSNPKGLPILFIMGFYHSREDGTWGFAGDSTAEGDSSDRSWSYGGSKIQYRRNTLLEIDKRGRAVELAEAPYDLKIFWRKYAERKDHSPLGGLLGHRCAKVQWGQISIGEIIVADGVRALWYLNSGGKILQVPPSRSGRRIFYTLFRLRLICFPFWSGQSWATLTACAVGALLDLGVLLDHIMFNGHYLLLMLRFDWGPISEWIKAVVSWIGYRTSA